MLRGILISKRKGVGLKHWNDSIPFIGNSNDMDGIYENIDVYNRNKQTKVLIIYDDMITDMFGNKKLQQIVKELFNIGRKLWISLLLLNQKIID